MCHFGEIFCSRRHDTAQWFFLYSIKLTHSCVIDSNIELTFVNGLFLIKNRIEWIVPDKCYCYGQRNELLCFGVRNGRLMIWLSVHCERRTSRLSQKCHLLSCLSHLSMRLTHVRVRSNVKWIKRRASLAFRYSQKKHRDVSFLLVYYTIKLAFLFNFVRTELL